MKKKIVGVALVALMFVGVVGCGKKADDAGADNKKAKATDWAKIEQSGEIVVGVDDTFVPMGFRDEKDELVGFDIDIAQAVAKELGVTAKIQPIEWSMKETELENGTIDLIWNGYTITDERKEKVDFTKPYLKNEQVIVTLKKNKIEKYEDMQGKVIGAQEGSSGAAALEEKPEILLDLVKDKKAVLYPTFVETFMDLNSGRLDAFIIDSVFAEYYISKENNKEDYLILPSEFEQEDYAVGVRKGDKETLKKMNAALKKLYTNGEAEKISKKWFNENRIVEQ